MARYRTLTLQTLNLKRTEAGIKQNGECEMKALHQTKTEIKAHENGQKFIAGKKKKKKKMMKVVIFSLSEVGHD